ncbi:hypothetical protein DOTSEDRAFT_175017 [Dothistroma septosporum NZE10]|uniref:F-box domain-containing protein n=1 Tax=Dothistroma septosporum (strain NZE10 / CBS 128990) TaxID=675120 RepID=N1PHR8_DOTSN|nr:hypothetical protein DOTSEDRAFT_175017 [Dothistroma septosporum NZE10]
MARMKQLKRNVSPELGEGDFAINFNANGRAIRKCRTRQRDSPFEDSAIAISDDSEDDTDEIDGEVIPVAPTRKRKRSPSPEDSLPPDHFEALSETDSDASEHNLPDSPSAGLAGHTTVHLTLNIPVGHQGPITLHLDPKTITSQPAPYSRPDRLTQSTMARLNARSKSKSSKYAGFLDLPAELRNEIYRMIFTSEQAINFGCPDNFSRSGQLLRACNQVHEEGRSILYGENRFVVERRTQRYGSFWENEWRELGYLNVRRFIKLIGAMNTALIRHLTLMLEDAVPCLNPSMRTNEERRFVHDDDLMSLLRHLGRHSQLQNLELHFHGRRRVDRTDDRFLDYMKRIKADEVRFIDWPPQSKYSRESKQEDAVKQVLLTACFRKKKRFD